MGFLSVIRSYCLHPTHPSHTHTPMRTRKIWWSWYDPNFPPTSQPAVSYGRTVAGCVYFYLIWLWIPSPPPTWRPRAHVYLILCVIEPLRQCILPPVDTGAREKGGFPNLRRALTEAIGWNTNSDSHRMFCAGIKISYWDPHSYIYAPCIYIVLFPSVWTDRIVHVLLM